MSSRVHLIAKENTISSIAGKVNPSGGTDFSSIKKRSKALSDVKNTILQRKNESSKLDPKKQLNFGNNYHFNVEKSLTEKPVLNTSSSATVKECVTSVSSISEIDVGIEEEIVSLPLCTTSDVDDDDDIDIDECPFCFKNDDFDDWHYGIGEKAWTDEEIMKICCGSIPRQHPSPAKNFDDWLKEEYKFIESPRIATGKIDHEIASFSPLFKLPLDLYLQNHEIAPVYHDD